MCDWRRFETGCISEPVSACVGDYMSVPVYLFTGFLESGKSTFLQDTLRDPQFNDGETTLVILCEDGEVEFDEAVLASYHAKLVYVEKESELTYENLCMWDKEYHPDRVMIEFNGMWSVTNFLDVEYPLQWLLVQILTTIDASTFAAYMSNMRSLLYDQMVHSELIIFNRCFDTTKKSFLRGNVKAINKTAQIIYESVDGAIHQLQDDVLPFDINDKQIEIQDDDYGLWYMDALENPQQYAGKEVIFKGRIVEVDHEKKNRFLIGREAMVCCAEDIQTIGFVVYDELSTSYKRNEWIKLHAQMSCEYDEEYGGEVPVLHTIATTPCFAIEDYVSFS